MINMVPIITWIPWNPVVKKNEDPKIESEIVKLEFLYSHHCRNEKYNPNIIVISILSIVCLSFFLINAWWAHVIDAPDLTSTIVFNNGISKGLNGLIPFGGHLRPISIEGAKLAWKNPQKNEIKNITSDRIKRIIPILIIFFTIIVWSPLMEDSRLTSRHHWYKFSIKIINERFINKISFLFIKLTVLINKFIKANDERIGHGLLVTKWNGWFFFIWNFWGIYCY